MPNDNIDFRFCFTLDTEPDDLWADRYPLQFGHFARLLGFHKDLVAAGARPVYLTTSEVAENDASREALAQCLETGPAELGAHFHSWTRDWPFTTHSELLAARPPHAMAHQLPQHVEEQMLAYTCTSLRTAFGHTPRSYRGGRWSLGPLSVKSLEACGIEVDSTVTPGFSWSQAGNSLLQGPDFTRHSSMPCILPGGTGAVTEIPVGTATFPTLPSPFFATLPVRALVKGARLCGIPAGQRWLRPTSNSVSEMRAVMRSLKRRGVPVWVMMIHSSEIAPCTPLPNETAVKAFVRRCLESVEAAQELGARPATLKEASDWLHRSGRLN